MTLADEHVATLVAIVDSDSRIRQAREDVVDWNVTIAETRKLIAYSQRLLAESLPVRAVPLLPALPLLPD